MPTTPFAGSILAVLVGCALTMAGDGLIVIDGSFNDWADVQPVVIDPPDAPDSPVDFGAIACRADGRFVHLLIDLGREANVQHLRGRGLILLDADGNPATGLQQFGLDGTDVIVELTPPSTRSASQPGMGFGLRSTTYNPDPADPATPALTPYHAGLTFSPTYASRQTEIRIERGVNLPATPPFLAGNAFRAKLVFLDISQQVRDETEVFACTLPPLEPTSVMEQPRDPLVRPFGTAVRAMNWNCEFGSIFQRPEVFGRILRAIEPFVIHFQEIPGDRTAGDLEAFLNGVEESKPLTARWRVIVGEGGGDLRCAVASFMDLQPVDALRIVPFPDRPDRQARVAGGSIDVVGKRILLVSVHLKCCGYAGSNEDQTRLREVEIIRTAIDQALAAERFDGVILSGDLNLVGSRTPLDRLVEPGAQRATAWSVVEAYQLDRRTNATWSDRGQPFVPGRLDYMLWSGPPLSVRNSFVFESCDLSPKWLSAHCIEADDSRNASDHFPVVADFFVEPTP